VDVNFLFAPGFGAGGHQGAFGILNARANSSVSRPEIAIFTLQQTPWKTQTKNSGGPGNVTSKR
jgi:hypothetical protein